MLDFRDVITDPLLQSGKQDAIDALRKAGALVSQPSDSEGNPWDGDSNNTYDYIDHIQSVAADDRKSRARGAVGPCTLRKGGGVAAARVHALDRDDGTCIGPCTH